MAKKRGRVSDDKSLFAKTEPEKQTGKGEVSGKSRATFYISDSVLDDLHEFWSAQPRGAGLSKSEVAERAIVAWLEENTTQ